MAKYYRPFIKFTNWALAGLLTFFGFSCGDDDNGDDGGGWVEYGTPTATYAVKGKVLDKSDSQPVSDIRVIVNYDPDYAMGSSKRDTVQTDQNGLFESSRTVGYSGSSVLVIASDEKNDVFLPDTSSVSFKGAEFVGGTGWYNGKAEKEVTIYLNKKESEEDE